MSALGITCEGLEKAIRGGEWKSIKIPHRNLTYIPKSTWCTSFVTRSRLSSYRQAIGPRNQVRNRHGNTNQCRQDHVQDRWWKSNRKTVYILTVISPNIRWTRSKNRDERAIWITNPWVICPVIQEIYRHLPIMIHTQVDTKIGETAAASSNQSQVQSKRWWALPPLRTRANWSHGRIRTPSRYGD
jgi:hypothetical protein